MQNAQSFEFLNYDGIAIICELRVLSSETRRKARICAHSESLRVRALIAHNSNLVKFRAKKAQFVPVFGAFLRNPPLRAPADRPGLCPLPSSRSDPARLPRTVGGKSTSQKAQKDARRLPVRRFSFGLVAFGAAAVGCRSVLIRAKGYKPELLRRRSPHAAFTVWAELVGIRSGCHRLRVQFQILEHGCGLFRCAPFRRRFPGAFPLVCCITES